jgi:hypothetical protein
MSRKFKLKVITVITYAILITGIIFELFALSKNLLVDNQFTNNKKYQINIQGNIRQPGWYNVSEGTTPFEILKVAGVRPTSDLSQINVASQITQNNEYTIGTLNKPIITSKQQLIKMDAIIGEVSVTTDEGQHIPEQQGMLLNPGDHIQTENSSQALISIGNFSKLFLDNLSDIVVNTFEFTDNSVASLDITQNKGVCWYRLTPETKDATTKVSLFGLQLTVGGASADFLVEIEPNQIIINMTDGVMLIERTSNHELINLISGQSAKIFNDNRPIQISKLAPDLSSNDRFSSLFNHQSSNTSQPSNFNLLFCVTPGIYYIISIQFDKAETILLRIPERLLIEQFSQNISTIDKAFLYGGPAFASAFLESIFNARIDKYISADGENIITILNAIGGVTVNVDAKAAAALNLKLGNQNISGSAIRKYLSPAISGVTDSRMRQSQILKSFFEDIQSDKIAMTMLFAKQIVESCETNFITSEIVEQFTKFSNRADWQFKEIVMPTQSIKRNLIIYDEPDLKECRRILGIKTNE